MFDYSNRLARKFSQPAINRKKTFEHCPAPSHLKLFDVLAKHKRKPRTQTSIKTNKDVSFQHFIYII